MSVTVVLKARNESMCPSSFPLSREAELPCQWKQLGTGARTLPGQGSLTSTPLGSPGKLTPNWRAEVGTYRKSWFVSKILLSAFSDRELFCAIFSTHLLKWMNWGTSVLWQRSEDRLGLSAADWMKGMLYMHSSKLGWRASEARSEHIALCFRGVESPLVLVLRDY